jgi:hypothetical protein
MPEIGAVDVSQQTVGRFRTEEVTLELTKIDARSRAALEAESAAGASLPGLRYARSRGIGDLQVPLRTGADARSAPRAEPRIDDRFQ